LHIDDFTWQMRRDVNLVSVGLWDQRFPPGQPGPLRVQQGQQKDKMMATYSRAGAELYYEEHGEGFPVLLIAPGGMKSAIPAWDSSPWNPIDQLQSHFRVIAMDQRNAGHSTAPISADDGWQTYTDDQLGLMDHLGIDRFHVAGMCIGGPYCFGLIQSAAERVASAVLFQSIGRDQNRDAFYAMFDGWAEEQISSRQDVEITDVASFRENMYGNDRVLFNVDEAFVGSSNTPLCVLMGSDLYHPESTSRMIAEVAPNATFVEHWKDGAAREDAKASVLTFLQSNSTG
jgi:pimeloyl-ACP methyl ester carboxylesterase